MSSSCSVGCIRLAPLTFALTIALTLAGCGGASSTPVDGGSDAWALDAPAIDAGHDASTPVDVGHDAPAELDSFYVNPTPFDFGAFAIGCDTGTPVHTFTVTNTGGASTGVLAVTLGGLDASQFVIDRDSCSGRALVGGTTCTIDVSYRPTSPGDHTASLQVSSFHGVAISAALSGRALSPASLLLVPVMRHFGTVVGGARSADVDFTVRNAGGCALPVLASALTGANADQFHITSSTCDGEPLAGGATCVVTVVFAPTGVGNMTATLDVTAGTLTASSTLTGTSLVGESLTVTPVSWDFGAVNLGCGESGAQTFAVTNVGGASIGVTAVVVAGTNPGDFVIRRDTCTGATLPAGGSCALDVVFRPTGVGARVVTLAVSATRGFSGSAALSGTGHVAPVLAVTPSMHDYGTVALGATAGADFTVTNTCSAGALSVGSLTSVLTGIGSTQYSITASSCPGATLAGGESCVVTVTFAPTATGAATALLDVSSAVGGRYSADLTGIGG